MHEYLITAVAAVAAVILNCNVPPLSATGIMQACASHTFILWLPTIIEALINGRALGNAKAPVAKGATAAAAAASHNKLRSVILPVILAAVPYTVGAVAAWLVAASSQKRKEVYYHAAGSMFAAGIFFLLVRGLTANQQYC
jgi:hypothetical protein